MKLFYTDSYIPIYSRGEGVILRD